MGLMDGGIAADIADILGDEDEFAIPVIWSVTNGQTVTTRTVNGVVISHGLHINDEGIAVMTAVARVMVAESSLIAAGFPTRNSNHALTLKGDTVTWTDLTTGLQVTYEIRQQFGNDRSGMVSCTLGAYGTPTPPGRLIIGWIQSPVIVHLTPTPSTNKQTLANGDQILTDYSINANRTLTIPYMAGYAALSAFFLNGREIQDRQYTKASGTFSNALHGGFNPVGEITFDASIPIWQS